MAKAFQLPDPPPGCVKVVGPDGETPIIARAPRGPGPWWWVKHPAYGARRVQAASEDEALKKFAEEFVPGADIKWIKESMRLNQGRIAKIAAPVPVAPAGPKPGDPVPEVAK